MSTNPKRWLLGLTLLAGMRLAIGADTIKVACIGTILPNTCKMERPQ